MEVLNNTATQYDHLVSDHGVKANFYETLDSKSQSDDEVIFESSSSLLNKHDYSNVMNNPTNKRVSFCHLSKVM